MASHATVFYTGETARTPDKSLNERQKQPLLAVSEQKSKTINSINQEKVKGHQHQRQSLNKDRVFDCPHNLAMKQKPHTSGWDVAETPGSHGPAQPPGFLIQLCCVQGAI